MNKLRRSPITFCLALAFALVVLRVVLHDHATFRLEVVPNHDMSQGFAFFATNIHSAALAGEPAWWNPIGGIGYAQYYQSFLSPLAPTTHHIVFILWSQMIRGLALVGVRLPEYHQYLVVNFLVLPFLAYAAWIAFTQQLFRRRTTIVLLAIAYAFSGIGLWHSAWFYFQEPFSVFLLLAAYLAAMRRPTPARLALLGLAAVLQATSFNYWTLYNLFFYGIVFAVHAWTHPPQLRRFGRRLAALFAGPLRWRALAVTGLGLATVATWGILLGSIVREQAGNYERIAYRDRGEGEHFSMETAIGRAAELRHYTLELFNPTIAKAIDHYGFKTGRLSNPMHDARYLGCVLLPFLLLVPVMTWRRRERWLIVVAAGILVVCLASPMVAAAWKTIPMMDRIQHVFYFYSHYWQIVVLLLAGCGVDAALRRSLDAATRRRFIGVSVVLLTVTLVCCLVFAAVSHLFPYGDRILQANLLAATLTLFTAAAVMQSQLRPGAASRRLLALICVVLLTGDLTRYFREVSLLDRHFTPHHVANPVPLPRSTQRLLRQAWPDPDRLFDGGLAERAPIRNHFWPENNYLVAKRLLELGDLKSEVTFAPETPLAFRRNAEPQREVTAVRRRWSYNRFEFEVTAPNDGWLLMRQLHDPCWHVSIDGQSSAISPANVVSMTTPISAGTHRVVLDYRPLARSLYGPACWLLEASLAAALLVIWRARARSSRRFSQQSDARLVASRSRFPPRPCDAPRVV
jgi:hypothetical protein